MADLQIAQVGCGGMGLRHLFGQIESKLVFGTFDYVAVCDLNTSAAEHVASEAERGLGKRPRVYNDFDEMLDKETSLDAVDIVTDGGLHHVLALRAFDAGKHVAVEKPLALTVRAGMKMIEAAERAGKVLSVSENYRRDPLNRLVKAVLDSNALGSPRLVIDISAGGTRHMPHATAWRHLKLRGGYLLDYAVHAADLLLYFIGEVDRVYAETHLWEQIRYVDEPQSESMKTFYRHRVKEAIERTGSVEVTSEDMAVAVVRFKSGAIGQFTQTVAAPGEGTGAGIVYCDDGSINLPGSRSGRPLRVTRMGEDAYLSEDATLDLVPGFQLDDITAPLFDGQRRISSYDIPFADIDRKLIALELEDFAGAIRDGREPEVSGQVGLDAVALTYALLESGAIHHAVTFADVAEDRVNSYQREINDAAGL